MKLKKLEITGFKSFPEKSAIVFPPGVSAIVGPNGCGKSNIIDALRWVMGEQSVKQLRGKSMDDIIFAGTNGKSPLNMAEVSLTLVNDNGSAPEELRHLTEINITRRLYRSGERACFINRQPCRFKDILNIFMGSGMGARSFAMIEQGNIGAITEAGPEERRVFIEEAAGVTRYKARKEEALRKVKSTMQNLDRINDIIVERGRQMNSLKRQAQKAEIYKKNQDFVKKYEVLLALHRFDEVALQIQQIEDVLRELGDSDIQHSTRISQLDAAVEEIKLRRVRKNQEIEEQKNRKHDVDVRLTRVEQDLKHQRTDAERLVQEIADFEKSRVEAGEKDARILDEIREYEINNARLHEESRQIRADVEKERTASQELKQKIDRLKLDRDERSRRRTDLMAREAQYRSIYQNAADNKENLSRRIRRIEEEGILARRAVKDLTHKQQTADEEQRLLKREIEEIDQQIALIRERLDEQKRLLAEKLKQSQTLDIERSKRRARYTALKKMDQNFDWYRDGVKAIMQRRKAAVDEPAEGAGNPNGIQCLMADIFMPSPGYETAVEAVLGESLQYVLVDNQAAGLESIDFLQTAQAGRSGFIPVGSLKNRMPDAAQTIAPGKRLLSQVTVKTGYEAVAETILGHVEIADSLAEAVEVWNRNGRVVTIVTREGNLITPHGVMIGGSKDKLDGILAKKQELQQLGLEIEELERTIETVRKELEALEVLARGLESDLQKLFGQKNEKTEEKIEAEKQHIKLSEELRHAGMRAETAELEHENMLGEESEFDDQMAKASQTLKEIEREIQTAADDLARAMAGITEVAEQYERHVQRIQEMQLELTKASTQFENSTHNLRRHREIHGDNVKRLEQLEQEIGQKVQRKNAALARIAADEKNLKELYDLARRLGEELERNEEDYRSIEARLKENDDLIADIQNQRETTQNKLRSLQLEKSELNLQKENFDNRLKERYHQSMEHFRSEFAEDIQARQMTVKDMEEELGRLHEKILKIGDVNMTAIQEYEECREGYDFLTKQRDDLVAALEDLDKVIKKINKVTREMFLETFAKVNEKLMEVFPRLFEGGTARLELTDPNDPLETGVEFMVHPPGKKLTRLTLLSGGEKALSAIAFIFSIFLIRPASFCLLDEIDAPLDEANVHRFNNLLKMIGEKSQIVMITHNKNSMEFADTLFGITMEKKGVSKIVSVNLETPN